MQIVEKKKTRTRYVSKVHKCPRLLAPSQNMTQGQIWHRVEGLGLAKLAPGK